MKKIIIVAFLTIIATATKAQTSRAIINMDDANLKSQIGDPFVNGIPYSQYKAQQDDIKQKAEKEKLEALQKREIEKANRIKLEATKIAC
jgi:hypothetical protein